MYGESPRIRRLGSEYQAMVALREVSTILDFQALGEPPTEYRVWFRGAGLRRENSQSPVLLHREHRVKIQLGAEYPVKAPTLLWESPIFHPNISVNGHVCIGGYGTYWVSSLSLDNLCVMLWDMVRYANYDPKSPYNLEAAQWARQQPPGRFPLDPRPLRDRLAGCPRSARSSSRRDGAHPALPPPAAAEIVFLDEPLLDAELLDEDDADVLIIE